MEKLEIDSNITNQDLLNKYVNSKRFDRINLLPIMAMRARTDENILNALFSTIQSAEEKRMKVMGFVKHAWLPAIYLLETTDVQVIEKLAIVLETWLPQERRLFQFYLKDVVTVSSMLPLLKLDEV